MMMGGGRAHHKNDPHTYLAAGQPIRKQPGAEKLHWIRLPNHIAVIHEPTLLPLQSLATLAKLLEVTSHLTKSWLNAIPSYVHTKRSYCIARYVLLWFIHPIESERKPCTFFRIKRQIIIRYFGSLYLCSQTTFQKGVKLKAAYFTCLCSTLMLLTSDSRPKGEILRGCGICTLGGVYVPWGQLCLCCYNHLSA